MALRRVSRRSVPGRKAASRAGVAAIIVAAGHGERLGSGGPKAFVEIGGKTLLRRSVEALAACPGIAALIVVAPRGWEAAARTESDATGKLRAVVTGGASRQDSVRAGLARTRPADHIVLIHDAARPFADADLVARVIDGAKAHGAAIPVAPLVDTIKRVRAGRIGETLGREMLGAAQTPQGFNRRTLLSVYARAARGGATLTDEAMAMEREGLSVAAVEGSGRNFKITTPDDLDRARRMVEPVSPALRVGHGFDAHRLVAGRPLMLGGIRVPSDVGLLGHSDGDALLHAICDALLGASGLGELGSLFPSGSKAHAGVPSSKFVRDVRARLEGAGLAVVNLDATLIAERPRLAEHLKAMRKNIARLLGVAQTRVSIKVKSADALGAIGRGEGIAAHALCLVGAHTSGPHGAGSLK